MHIASVTSSPLIPIIAILIGLAFFTAFVKATLRLIGCGLMVLLVLGAAAYFGSGAMH